MFSSNTPADNLEDKIAEEEHIRKSAKTKAPPNIYPLHTTSSFNDIAELNINNIDKMLDKEKTHNKTESWNKLDKTVKIQKLHAFSEKYGKANGLPVKEIKNLKAFFVDCLEKSKLQKTKDVTYDKDLGEITAIPALYFNSDNRAFTLRIMDAKRVSTLKSLTPKRVDKSSVDKSSVDKSSVDKYGDIIYNGI